MDISAHQLPMKFHMQVQMEKNLFFTANSLKTFHQMSIIRWLDSRAGCLVNDKINGCAVIVFISSWEIWAPFRH